VLGTRFAQGTGNIRTMQSPECACCSASAEVSESFRAELKPAVAQSRHIRSQAWARVDSCSVCAGESMPATSAGTQRLIQVQPENAIA